MAKDFARSFYAGSAWLSCRAAYIASVFGLCESCGDPGHIVHHIIPITPENINDPYITLSWSNLRYLCQRCHNAAHGENNPLRDDVQFTPDGQLVRR